VKSAFCQKTASQHHGGVLLHHCRPPLPSLWSPVCCRL
jgi:hypothetical protein